MADQFGMDPRRRRCGSETEEGASQERVARDVMSGGRGGPIVARARRARTAPDALRRGPPAERERAQAAEGPSGQYGGGSVARRPGGGRGRGADGRAKGRTFDSFDACQADASA